MLIPTFIFKILLIFSTIIAPGLKISGLWVKSIIVDSRPISDLPPSIINLTLSPNSSTTSLAQVGLSLDAIFALGAARGTSNIFSKFLATLCLGILTAIVFLPAVTILEIFDLDFLFNIKVIGPGQKALYSFIKFSLQTTSFFK